MEACGTSPLGGGVGVLSAFFTAKWTFGNELKKERVKRINETLTVPVIDFINRVLESASGAYWEYLDSGSKSVSLDLQDIQRKDSVAEARVEAIGERVLVEEFRAFTHQFSKFRGALSDNARDPYIEKQKLEEMAGRLLKKLLNVISK